MQETTDNTTAQQEDTAQESSAQKSESSKFSLDSFFNEADIMRQELALQMHLAQMDAKDEYEKLDKHFESFKVKSKEMLESAGEFGEEFGEDLQESFKRFASKFKEQYENIKNKM